MTATTQLMAGGYALLDAGALGLVAATPIAALLALSPSWDRLPRDAYLRDGGRYRARRHACFVQELPSGELIDVPHRAHYQPTTYNALHGGIERWFEPVEPAVVADAGFRGVIAGLGRLFAAVRGTSRWHIEAHQFRIDTEGGIGRPTPEGAHRDGVDFVAIVLIGRRSVDGGATTVFTADGKPVLELTLTEPGTTLLLDDARVIHQTSPIRATADYGCRDTLVVTWRARGFQQPGE